ncbi:Enhancer of polycomb-like protein 1 [Leucoagaricus sp. SymC.cos]|nr:Enhancer of polycomb-like protein 1 [Leucoagaricus sp. SymC.cos]
MPRNHLPGASTLRNRNRVTNKTRLKIHHGSLDADALLIPDEDEEKHRLTNLVAGVDAEDANEHHLQEVLSAAHRANAAISRAAKGITEKPAATAYIPTPDSTGIVENYEEFYPLNRWKDPATYVCTSLSVEEHAVDSLAGGFTYYMDERDKEWLDKNNEEARGEGTSAQGAVSTSGTRTSARSAKAKGKEPDVSQPVVISEDEFELVIGIYEKLTSEKYEYLHHVGAHDELEEEDLLSIPQGLETGMFPAFTDYQDTFSNELPLSMFASFVLPSWLPKPPQLLRIARTIYPYWKERRVERGGHRIIPTLNGDESDTLNESYICFRRREIKAVRKTRASQVSSSDKLTRLQAELLYPLELAKLILNRESTKKECAQQAKGVWEKRQAVVDLKRVYPAAFSDKADEELLVDKERPVKKLEPASRIPGLRIRTQDSAVSTPRQDMILRPKERINAIREQIEATLARQKDQDHHWEDQIDNVYQQLPAPYASRLFKYIQPPESPSLPSSDDVDDDPPSRPVRSVRLRVGRGGRRMLDRRNIAPRSSPFKRQKLESSADESKGMDMDEDAEELERQQRQEERWRYDQDDLPAVGPQGQDEQDRMLVDEYQTKYLRHTMTLLADSDQASLMTDNALPVVTNDGRQLMFVPFRLGVPPSIHRRDASGNFRPIYPALAAFLSQPPPANNAQLPVINGAQVALQQQIKKMPPPVAVPQMRISSNGGMRPSLPATNGVNGIQSTVSIASHNSPPQPVPVPQHTSPNGVNGVASRPAIAMPHVDVVKTEVHQPSALANGVISVQQTDSNQSTESTPTSTSPARPKSQTQTVTVPANGFHMSNNFAATLAPATYAQLAGNTALQNLKTTFASLPQSDFANLQSQLQRMPYMLSNSNLQLNANANLKAAAARQMQWVSSPLQRPTSTGNGLEGVNGINGVNGGQSSPTPNHVAATAPTTNGSRPAMRIPSNGQMSMSPMPQHTPSPLPHIAQSQSPPRLPMTPTMTMASPSLPQQQAVGNSQVGY